jgi:hypothetical protein
MRTSLLAISVSILCACAGDDLTAANGGLILTVPATSVGPGDSITAVVTNRSRLDFSDYYGCVREGRPFDRRVGTDWVRLPSTDTLPCAAIVHSETLHPGASRNYVWKAPSDTGTYRVALGLGLGQGSVTLISHQFVVR